MTSILLGICLKNNDYKTALEYLDIIAVYNDGNPTYSIAPVFKKALRTNKKARKILIPELTKTRNRRSLTVERNVDLEYLDTYYKDVIIASKKNIDYADKALYNSDISFYNSILFLHSIKHNSKRNSLKYAFGLVSQIRLEEADEDHFYHMFPLVRYFATYIMYLHLSKKLDDKQLNLVIERIETLIIDKYYHVDIAPFAVSEVFRALVFCERYNDVVFLYNKYIKQGIKIDGEYDYYQLTLEMLRRSYLALGIK